MVGFFKNNLLWSIFLFFVIVISSVLSKWVDFLDLGIFNYSLLLVLFLLLPNLKLLLREIKNSEIEKINLPFCELKLLKKYDYYFLGSRINNESNENNEDLVILGFYKNVLNEKEASCLFKKDFPNKDSYEVSEIVKQVHYKKNDD